MFNPSPYDPTRDPSVLAALARAGSGATSARPLTFDGLPDAAHKMTVLGDGYGGERDTIMRQQVALDLTILGLTSATVINPIFQGARAATIGLGLGAGAVGAGRAYFAPQSRASFYNAAALRLGCGANVADNLAVVEKANEVALSSVAERLRTEVATADGLLLNSNGGGGTGGPAFLAARDRARTALSGAITALDILTNARWRLQAFAARTVLTTTQSVFSGVQNLNASLAALNSATAVGNPVPPSAGGSGGGSGVFLRSSATDVGMLTNQLNADSADAERLASTVADVWASLATCLSEPH